MNYENTQARLAAYDQTHLLRWYGELSPSSQQKLLEQIATIDFEWLKKVLAEQHASSKNPQSQKNIQPYTKILRPTDADAPHAFELGEAALHRGQVGVILVAGGQGTRLGFNGPKGAFVIDPPAANKPGRTLFQLHCERLLSFGKKYGHIPPLYLMTSDDNHQATLDIFQQHQYFGLPKDRVRIFPQASVPAVDFQGKLFLDAKDHILVSPNGNGGLLLALAQSGALDHMKSLNIDALSYIQVDNALAKSADPLFVGFHLLHHAEYSCKGVAKTNPQEAVGVFADVDGKLAIVEYYELSNELAEARDAQGNLRFGLGNPGIFMWSRGFLERQARRQDLPVHFAQKKIPHIDHIGKLVQPTAPNGHKLEWFALDTLTDAKRSVLLECDRDREFAPLKNATGPDSPATVRALLARV